MKSENTSKKRPIPLFLSVLEVSRLLGWNKKRTVRWLTKNDLLVDQFGYMYVRVAVIREKFPEMWEEYCDRESDVEISKPTLES